jgi:hypothetical protein
LIPHLSLERCGKRYLIRLIFEYAKTAKLLAKKDENGSIKCKFLGSSIDENEAMLSELLELKKRVCKPSIPHLVY